MKRQLLLKYGVEEKGSSRGVDVTFFGLVAVQGLLDEQFSQLQQLQDENTPDFVEEVVALFFEDSERILGELTESLYVSPTRDPHPFENVVTSERTANLPIHPLACSRQVCLLGDEYSRELDHLRGCSRFSHQLRVSFP